MKKLNHAIARNFVLTSFSALSVLAVAPAQAVILDFQSLEHEDNLTTIAGSGYLEDDFEIITPFTTPFFTFGTLSPSYAGSTALLASGSLDSITVLARLGRAPFTLSSIDLGNTSLAPSTRTVSFTGIKSDNSPNVTQNFTTDPDVINLRTFNFSSDFTDLLSVILSGDGVEQYYQIDNININDNPTPSTAVPEPFTIVGTLIGGTAAIRMRKKLSVAKSINKSS